jgi:phage terminase large subunit GpA-like protein
MLQIPTQIQIDARDLTFPVWYRPYVPIGRTRFMYRVPHKVAGTVAKRRPMRVSKWSEKHRVLTMSTLPGPWRNDVTPYLAGIMDAAGFSSVEDMVLCKAPQVGGSEAANNFVGYCIDRMPGPVLYVYPDEQTAKENSNDRIQPMIEHSPRLKEYITGRMDDLASFRINLIHMPIYLAWARSASRLANKPIRHLIFDETDKYPDTTGKREADPISLGEKRTTTYEGRRKRWKLSSPTTWAGVIWQSLLIVQALFAYWVRCPFCGGMQVMVFEQIKWPEDERDPERVKNEKLASYECEHCRALWKDTDRDKAVRSGIWRHQPGGWQGRQNGTWQRGLTLNRYLIRHRPKSVGFHMPAWLSRFVSLSETAGAFLRGLKNKIKLRDFMNGHKAEPWIAYEVTRTEDAILALRDDRPRGVVPCDGVVAGLTAGVDTQDYGFYYEIDAWGYGMAADSWQVREGFAPSFAALEQILWKDHYADKDGKRYVVQFTVMDAMGHRTVPVYDWCRMRTGRVIAFKGEQRMNQPIAYTQIDYYPGTKKPIPGGLRLLRGNVTHYKNELSRRLQIASADPGAWHLHSEATVEWARQMTAEYVDDKGLWQCKSGMANHAWDVSVYALIAADVIGIKYRRKEAEGITAKGRRIISKGVV